MFSCVGVCGEAVVSFRRGSCCGASAFRLFRHVTAPGVSFARDSGGVIIPTVLPPLEVGPILSDEFVSA